jgi:hypothetical protein
MKFSTADQPVAFSSTGSSNISQRRVMGLPAALQGSAPKLDSHFVWSRVARKLDPVSAASKPNGFAADVAVSNSDIQAGGSHSGVGQIQRLPESVAGVESMLPTLPSMSQSDAGHEAPASPDVSVLADRVYELIVQRIASERQRRGL